MTQRRKKQRAPEPSNPARSKQIASAAVDRLVSGSAHQVRRPYGLLAVCGFLILAVIIVFGQTASHDFVNFDDNDYVYENPHVRGGLTGAGAAWAITTYHAANWHLLTWLSHMLDCQLYGLKPGGHHLTNVFLHVAAAILLFLALRRMTGALWCSAWVAAVFAIHPLRVESVAWVAERKDVLSGLLFMLVLWLYAHYAQRPDSWGRYLLVVASFALGLTAKPMLVTLPFVLLLLDYWPLGRLKSGPRADGGRWTVDGKEPNQSPTTNHHPLSISFPRLIVEKIPLFILAAVSCVVTLAAQREAMRSLEQVAPAGRVGNAAVAYVAYLGKMLYPAGLAALYPFPKAPPPVWEVLAAATVLLAISTAVFVARRKCPCLLFGWLWYLGTLLPVSGLVQVGNQAMADRYTYLTQIGLYMALAWGAAQAAASRPSCRWPFAAVSALVAAGLMVCAWQQTRHWRDSQTLWTHTLACTPQNQVAHCDLGNALVRRGQVVEAIEHYKRALEIKPNFAEAHCDLGNALVGRGQVDEAIGHYRRALEIRPDYFEAHNNLGLALAGRGQVDEAIILYRKALKIEPDYVEAHNNLGNALAGSGQVDEAIAHYRRALEIKPDFAEANYNLGLILAHRGQVDEAIEHYQKALGLASARDDRALAEFIQARIRLLQSGAPSGKNR
ncbi:MAG: tetratricopeptide repeat protein [Thermoguttaceae bacterium]